MTDYINKYQIRWEKVHSNIFSEFILKLNKSKVRYFILRNFEGLPETNTSKDIDIIIEPNNYHKASKLLVTILKEHKISNYRVVKFERVHCCFAIDVEKNFSIHIDLIESYLSKGFEVFTFNALYKETVDYKNFKVLNETYNTIMLLYYKVISTKQLKTQYQNEIKVTYKKNSNKINSVLNKTLGSKRSKVIIAALLNQDFKAIIYNANELSKFTKRKAFLKKPIKTTYNITRFLCEKFYRIVYCPRRYQNFISVQGADGTGKSTFIEGLVKAIAYFYVSEDSKSHVYHHRPAILPNLGALGEKTGLMIEDKDFTNPHRAKPAGFFSSLIRMTYYWLDYLIGVPVKLRKDVQFDKFTIYDRYIYDFLIDPRRARIKLPYWLRKIFTQLVLQPRIVFILLTDAEIIYARKQELTIVEIKRQIAEFTKLSKSHKRFIILDASKTTEELVDEAMGIIIEKFTQRIL